MPKIKLHYDGWLALPAGLREELGLTSGDPLEVTLIDGALVLRPVAKEHRAARRQAAPQAPASEVAPLPELAQEAVAAPRPAPKRRGRPPKPAAAGEPAPASPAAGDLEPSELRKKTVPPPAATAEIAAPSLGLGRRHRGEAGHRPADERRPFRQVEVKKLGPGRGPNRHHRRPPGTAV